MADPKINKCDNSAGHLTCDDLFKLGCITAEENQFCEGEWHLDMEPIVEDEFIIRTPEADKPTSLGINPLFYDTFGSLSIEDEVCYESDDDVYFNQPERVTCEDDFDIGLYQSLIPTSLSDLECLLTEIGATLDSSIDVFILETN